MARQRRKPASNIIAAAGSETLPNDSRKMTTTQQDSGVEPPSDGQPPPAQWSTRTQWIFFAVASGVCAAFNGAFAKLTTTELTKNLSDALSTLLGLSAYENAFEYAVRAFFFVLNLVFNGVMWSLFTTALARGTSATQVSIMNTSTNFLITALLGMVVFSEKLPPLWWAGASLLIVGNVITGRKNDGDEPATVDEAEPLIPFRSRKHRGLNQGGCTISEDDDSDSDVPDLPM